MRPSNFCRWSDIMFLPDACVIDVRYCRRSWRTAVWIPSQFGQTVCLYSWLAYSDFHCCFSYSTWMMYCHPAPNCIHIIRTKPNRRYYSSAIISDSEARFARLSGDSVGFSAHVNIPYRIVSYRERREIRRCCSRRRIWLCGWYGGLPARERFINCRHSSSVLFCCF